jgi:hypothetical protein
MATSYNSKIVTDGLVLCLDAANPKSYSPNVHPYPTDIYSWITTGYNCTLSRDTIQSPVGTKPLKMVQTGDDTFTHSYSGSAGIWKLAPAVSGQTWTVSVWVKASAPIQIEGCWIAEQDSSGNYLAGGGSPNPSITTSWTRISGTYTLVNASTAFVGIRLDGTQTGGTGVTIWWDGLQVERSSSMTAFNSKTNANNANWFDASSTTTASITGNLSYSSNQLLFDGSSYATILYNSKFNFDTSQTICIWLKPTEDDLVNRRNPYNQAYGGGGTITHEINGTLTYYWGTAGTNTSPYSSAGSGGFTVGLNESAYITVVRDITNVKMYKNGILLSTTTNPYGNTVVTGTQNILIGSGFAGPAYQGNIPTIQLYTTALTADQVSQNFNATRGRYGL